jgi:hypothetical protein
MGLYGVVRKVRDPAAHRSFRGRLPGRLGKHLGWAQFDSESLKRCKNYFTNPSVPATCGVILYK